MRYKLINILLACGIALILCPSIVNGQTRPKITGLGDNKEYVELLEQEKQLRSKDDSMSMALDALRTQLRANPEDRARYSPRILELEGSLFDIRSRIGSVTGRISIIEQDYVLKSLESGVAPAVTGSTGQSEIKSSTNYADLVSNDFFSKNLKSEDYIVLKDAQAKEGTLYGYLTRYRDNYRALTLIEAEYPREKDKEKADSIYANYIALTDLNQAISDSVSTEWGYVFDNKTYFYSYLLEKMNRVDVLEQINKSTAQEKAIENENAGKYSSDAIAFYSMRKSLMLDIELRMAELAELSRAKDSLSRARLAIDTVSFTFEPIDLPEKLFIDFLPVTVSPGKYNAKNPIPEVEVHKRGVIYRIQIGTFQRLQPVNVFRNVYPLAYQVGDDNRFRYFAGCFETVEEAVEGLAAVKKAGFRDPFIVVWDKGEFRNLWQGAAASVKTNARFRVEIDTGGKPLSAAMQSVVANSGKELTKVGNVIILSTFDSRITAEKILSELREAGPGVGISVVEIKD